MPKKITVLLAYANPHVLGWVRELRNFDIQLKIYCTKSVIHYRKGYFLNLDDCKDIIYLFKGSRYLKELKKDLAETDIYITLGIFEKVFLKTLSDLKVNSKAFVLSEPFNPISSKKYIFLRKIVSLYIRFKFKNINFLCIGGLDVKSYYLSLGFKNCNYYNFGYFPKQEELHKVETKNKIRFIFVGQLIERKGIDYLINALHYLNINYDSNLWDFKIIGDGILKNKLNYEIEQINNSSIKYLGLITKDSVIQELYSNSDILFISSIFDGWGAVVNEALSKNLAILSSNMVYSSRSLINHGFNGFLYGFDDLNKMNKGFDFFLREKSNLLSLKKNSKKIYKEWNSKNAAKSFLKLIENKNNTNKSLLSKI